MAVPDAHSLSVVTARKRSHSDMRDSTSPTKWIDEDLYRRSILHLHPAATESEADEFLQRDARDLGILPAQSSPDVNGITSSLSATTISSETNQSSVVSQSTAPTSCASSERRPSTSLSNRSSRVGATHEASTIMTEMERKRHSGIRIGLRKMTGFRRKKLNGLSTPSLISISSQVTNGTTAEESPQSPTREAESIRSGNSCFSAELPTQKPTFEAQPLIDEEALARTMDSKEMMRVRAQQLEEKRRFLEYQTTLISQLMEHRNKMREEKEKWYRKLISEQEEKNEKQVEELEARQLEEELKQMKDHEAEKRAIQTRLKHMEAYCQTPSPPTSPTIANFPRHSIDSNLTLPERHITQQHYESLAQVYHVRDNMDDLHASKINVLRGKQKRALQSFMLKKEREIEHLERDCEKELASINLDFGRQEAEIRQEFEAKRSKLEARWKLQALVEKTKMERSTGLKYEELPDILAVEA